MGRKIKKVRAGSLAESPPGFTSPNLARDFLSRKVVGFTLSRVQSKRHTIQQNEGRLARRSQRYTARRLLGFKSSLQRVRFCGRDMVPGKDGVTVLASGSGLERRAGFGNVQHCGSTWACPVCSHKINAGRAAELARVVAAWHAPVFGPQLKKPLAGGRVIFLTLTMRHNKFQRLEDLWTDGISAGWAKVTSGRAWKDEQEDFGTLVGRKIKTGKRAGQWVEEKRIGFARVVETTHGANGWHVHVHALLFVSGSITGDQAMKLGRSMFGRWKSALVGSGFDAPTLVNGVDVRLIGPTDSTKVAEYFNKNTYAGQEKSGMVGWEAAGGTGKSGSKRFGNRTPFQILADVVAAGDADADVALVAAAGADDDLALWWEWEQASKGKRQLTWSPWLRDYLALGEEETDQGLADATLDGETVLTLRAAQWKVIEPRADGLLAAVEADDDLTAAYAWLQQHCRHSDGDPLFSPGEFAHALVLIAA